MRSQLCLQPGEYGFDRSKLSVDIGDCLTRRMTDMGAMKMTFHCLTPPRDWLEPIEGFRRFLSARNSEMSVVMAETASARHARKLNDFLLSEATLVEQMPGEYLETGPRGGAATNAKQVTMEVSDTPLPPTSIAGNLWKRTGPPRP